LKSALRLAMVPLYAVGFAAGLVVYAAGRAWREYRLQQEGKLWAGVHRVRAAREWGPN